MPPISLEVSLVILAIGAGIVGFVGATLYRERRRSREASTETHEPSTDAGDDSGDSTNGDSEATERASTPPSPDSGETP
jgi:hypothetical protein